MNVHAASGDTWGISGPTFLRYYIAAAVLVVAIAAYYRIRLAAGSSAAMTADPLGPQQVAYLNGGPQLAVHAALGGLRGSGAVGVRPDRRLTTVGAAPTGLTPLTRPSTGPPTSTRGSGTCHRTSAYASRCTRSATAWSSAGC